MKSGKTSYESNESDDVPMNEDDQKLLELIRNNTMTNRDILNKEKTYMKKIEPQYREIYGDKGIQFCQDENKNNTKRKKRTNKKGKRQVKFASIVQYSRN